jgi:hypothetical protein
MGERSFVKMKKIAFGVQRSGENHFSTRKFTLLVSLRRGVTTLTLPVVAPVGTLVVISELETTLNFAALPLNVTLFAPVKLFPRMITLAPTLPELGRVSMNGPSPTPRLKIVPQFMAQFALVPGFASAE